VTSNEGDLFVDCNSFLARWGNYLPKAIKCTGFSDVRQTEIITSAPLVRKLNAIEFDFAIEKLKCHQSQVID